MTTGCDATHGLRNDRARSLAAADDALDVRTKRRRRESARDDVVGTLPGDELVGADARAHARVDGALTLVETLLGHLRRERVESDATRASGERDGGRGEDHARTVLRRPAPAPRVAVLASGRSRAVDHLLINT